MKKYVFILSCLMAVCCLALDTNQCISLVRTLQHGDSSTRQAVLSELMQQDDWTLLDEIGDYHQDEKREFLLLGLNDMAYEAASARLDDYGSASGVFVDGRDQTYPICFIEKCIGPGQDVVYTLTDRRGKQQLCILEMNDDDLTIHIDGHPVEAKDKAFSAVSDKENISICIHNRRGYALSFVIINQHMQ